MVLFGNFFIARKRSSGLEYKDEDHYMDNKMVGVLSQHNTTNHVQSKSAYDIGIQVLVHSYE